MQVFVIMTRGKYNNKNYIKYEHRIIRISCYFVGELTAAARSRGVVRVKFVNVFCCKRHDEV